MLVRADNHAAALQQFAHFSDAAVKLITKHKYLVSEFRFQTLFSELTIELESQSESLTHQIGPNLSRIMQVAFCIVGLL